MSSVNSHTASAALLRTRASVFVGKVFLEGVGGLGGGAVFYFIVHTNEGLTSLINSLACLPPLQTLRV